MDNAIEKWQLLKGDKKLDMDIYEQIRDEWMSKDKVAKVLGIFSSPRLNEDWEVAETEDAIRKKSKWEDFIRKMETFYKPTENITLKHFQFRSLTQNTNESFSAFCNRVAT